MVCSQGPIDCRECTLKAVCPYPYIFETAPFEGAQQLRTYDDVPRPFVIDPLGTQGEYRRGESFAFQLTLIGRAIDYLPYFLVSFRDLGEIGIGKKRGRFQVTQVLTDSRESVYDSDTQMVHNFDNALSFDEIQREAVSLLATRLNSLKSLTLHLLTPTRITHEGELTNNLPFHIFWRRLIGRISALAYFHCSESLELDFKGLIEEAKTVETTETALEWKDWTRYSSRQDQKMQLGGLVGNVTYTGDLAMFMPFVVLGEFLHVGKNATFGLGKYRIE
jgi:DNA-binding transcriptional regulator of glucitol operon